MINGQKHYIKLFGIKTFKIKAITKDYLKFYLLGLPLLIIKTTGNKTNVNFLLLQKVYDHIKKHTRIALRKRNRKNICKRYQNGEKIKIALLVARPRMWCFDYLYKLLVNNPLFDVSIVIMPDPHYPNVQVRRYIQETKDELEQKGYSPIIGYDGETNTVINFRKDINPDIIFYTDFWRPHFVSAFYITNFLDRINLLNEYGFSVMQDELTCNFELNNLVDIYFRPTDIHKEMAEKLMLNQGTNVVISGSPKLDQRFDKDYKVNDPWKQQNKPKKRIIWAPHYNSKTPKNMYKNDGFWKLHETMFNIAEKFKDKVQFVFRPHPVLYPTLISEWGEKKTDRYYAKWNNLENGQIFEGDFADLFMMSDAMIMDSCSFMAEYTAFDKPLFHTVTDTSRTNLNEFGEMLYENFYKTENDLENDIEKFIQEVVIKGNDYKAEQRHQFVQKYFGKINGKTASENIYNEIINLLEQGVK